MTGHIFGKGFMWHIDNFYQNKRTAYPHHSECCRHFTTYLFSATVAAIIIEIKTLVPPPVLGHLFPDNYGFNQQTISGLEVEVELEFVFIYGQPK